MNRYYLGFLLLTFPSHPIPKITVKETNSLAPIVRQVQSFKPIKTLPQNALEPVLTLPVVETPKVTTPVVPSAPVASDDYYVNWIIQHESSGNPYAVNKSSGACGLFQRYPCSVTLGDVAGQMADGLAYINSRYGSPYNAYLYWQTHGNY